MKKQMAVLCLFTLGGFALAQQQTVGLQKRAELQPELKKGGAGLSLDIAPVQWASFVQFDNGAETNVLRYSPYRTFSYGGDNFANYLVGLNTSSYYGANFERDSRLLYLFDTSQLNAGAIYSLVANVNYLGFEQNSIAVFDAGDFGLEIDGALDNGDLIFGSNPGAMATYPLTPFEVRTINQDVTANIHDDVSAGRPYSGFVLGLTNQVSNGALVPWGAFDLGLVVVSAVPTLSQWALLMLLLALAIAGIAIARKQRVEMH